MGYRGDKFVSCRLGIGQDMEDSIPRREPNPVGAAVVRLSWDRSIRAAAGKQGNARNRHFLGTISALTESRSVRTEPEGGGTVRKPGR